jgi:tryptophanyl-tRNA synthetase
MFSDLQAAQQGVVDDIQANHFTLFPDDRVFIGNYEKNENLSDFFLCHYNADLLGNYSTDEIAMVTGFGPSNAPTAGTLSMIFRVIEFQKRTGIYTHIVIPDLGFMNVRTTELQNIINTTEHFIRFIQALGFDENNGIIRTHNNVDLYRTFTIATSCLSLPNFINNKEATQDLYQALKLQGNDFSTLIHNTLCAADILLPIIKDKKKLVLVMSGVEEFYFTTLAKLVIESMKNKSESMSKFVNHNPQICSIFGRLIEGLFPYVKMSKSITDSSINLGDNEENIKKKIINCGKRNEFVILDMIMLASNWNKVKKEKANEAYNDYLATGVDTLWIDCKNQYADFFIKIKRLWESLSVENIDVQTNIYK